MASYFSGFMSSMKEYFGYDSLETVSGGDSEEKVEDKSNPERQSLWKQLSNYIGKDITSMISLPVWVFEPLSFLQIMCEPLQFEELLQKAAEDPDSFNRMAFLIAFIASGYSCAVRQKKPFNPILGETFEFVSNDKSLKFFSEQVSHHPPIGVAQAVTELYDLLLEMQLETKFRGNSSDVFVHGSNHFTTTNFGDRFSWNHLETCAHNVIIGGMWVDHFGALEVKNSTTGDKAVVNFTRCGWLGAGRYDLSGEIMDAEGNIRMRIQGKWNESIFSIRINDGVESTPSLLWNKPTDQTLNKWNWPKFVENLNVISDNYRRILPPTDSRLRSDRIHLEKDDLENAATEKVKLEEKQRAEKRERDEKGEQWSPKYFRKIEDNTHGHKYEYIGNYWEEREARIKAQNTTEDELIKSLQELCM